MKKTILPFLVLCGFLSSCFKEVVSPPLATAYKEYKNVSYGTHAQQTMDIYLPENRSKDTTPVVVMIHGGGWSAGDKSEVGNLVTLLKKYYPTAAIVNMNYRLVTNTDFKHPAQLQDIESVLDFLKAKQNDYSIAAKFGLIGNSAGAHLSMLYAYSTDSIHKDVKCVSSLYGPSLLYDWSWYNQALIKPLLENYIGKTWAQDTTAYINSSPYLLVKGTSAPTILFHGTVDVVVPLYQSQWMNSKLNSMGVPHEYHEYILDGHGFNDGNNADCIQKTVIFFKKHL